MSLLTRQKEPYIAEEDLLVYKALRVDTNLDGTTYTTVYTEDEVKLNTMLEGIGEHKGYLLYNFYEYDQGFVHSSARGDIEWKSKPLGLIVNLTKDLKVYEAYIPKGTKYFIDKNTMDFCSEKLYLTDKCVEKTRYMPEEAYWKIRKPLLDKIDRNNVSVGWLFMNNWSFVHPYDYNSTMDKYLYGIVIGIKNGEAIVMNVFRGDKFGYRIDGEADIPAEHIFHKDFKWEYMNLDVVKKHLFENIELINGVVVGIDIDVSVADTPVLCELDDGMMVSIGLLPFYSSYMSLNAWMTRVKINKVMTSCV